MTDDDSGLLWGSDIPVFIKRRPRQFYNMAERGLLPVWKAGHTYVGKKADLADPAKWPQPESKPRKPRKPCPKPQPRRARTCQPSGCPYSPETTCLGARFLEMTTAPALLATNPPYGRLAEKIVRHALKLTQPKAGKVAMLLPMQWDAAQRYGAS
jgi:hypothetical protein